MELSLRLLMVGATRIDGFSVTDVVTEVIAGRMVIAALVKELPKIFWLAAIKSNSVKAGPVINKKENKIIRARTIFSVDLWTVLFQPVLFILDIFVDNADRLFSRYCNSFLITPQFCPSSIFARL